MEIHNNREQRYNKLIDLTMAQIAFLENRDVPAHVLDRILKAKEYLDRNYAKQVSLSEASKMVPMNKTYFCYYFKRITGHSFTDYVNNIRIQRAKDLLKNRESPIAEIATTLGYNSVNYFIEVFRRICGFSPAEFRKKIGDTEKQ